ncbi:metabotropic glutamate receptor 2 [Nematostella vectensis]|uniref:metabotropic glutamate receptor 2 n=1 Tax=Nematostella vectensis TaxID=45351 RepID=UPI002077242C|nr:metabotropic glutamate receptor 2 [Nematostella vectensis]
MQMNLHTSVALVASLLLHFGCALPGFGLFSLAGNAIESHGIFQNGTFIIGGLFPVHFPSMNHSKQTLCAGPFNVRGYEEALAMFHAVEEINKRQDLLPGISIGVDIKDTCNSVDFAIRKSLNFSFIVENIQTGVCPSAKPLGTPHRAQTIALIGPASSDVAMAVTNLAGLFYVPVVDYLSSSRLLSNRIRFKYFLRTIASDSLLSRAIVDLLRVFRWNFIHVLYSDTDYGRSAIETFEYVLKLASNNVKICFATKDSFTFHSPEMHFKTVLSNIRKFPRAKAVLLFTTIQDTEVLLNHFHSENMNDSFFIASDYFSGPINQFFTSHEMLRRLIGVVPHVKKEDLEYFAEVIDNLNRTPKFRASPWNQEYRDFLAERSSTGRPHIPSLYVPYAMDAVYAVAHGLHKMLNCNHSACLRGGLGPTNLIWSGDRLLQSIQSVSFKGRTRDKVAFDSNGNGVANYDINIVNPLTDEWERVGTWASNSSDVLKMYKNLSHLTLNTSRALELWGEMYNGTGIPSSTCGRQCPPGHWLKAEEEHQTCCWQCSRCHGNSISNSPPNGSCQACPSRYWADDNHTLCHPITPTSVTFRDPPAVVVTFISTIGSITVIFVVMVFYRHGNTPLVRSSSRLLSHVMLFGIILGYATAVIIFAAKTEELCRTVLYLFSVSFSIVVGTLLVRTNRIHRIFSKNALRKGKPPCLSDSWMLLFIAVIVAMEIVICTVIILTTPDGLLETSYSPISGYAFSQCKFNATSTDYHMAVWWTYNACIILICTYQAYLTRKLPGNYNEARFIAFTTITISTDVLVFFFAFNGTRGYYKDVMVSSFLVLADTITISCVFLPKCYIILLRPEKNIVYGSVFNLGTIDDVKIGENEMRKISRVSQRSCTSYISSSSAEIGKLERSKYFTTSEDGVSEKKRKSSRTSQRSCASSMSSSSAESGKLEQLNLFDGKSRKRKISVFARNGYALGSEADNSITLNGTSLNAEPALLQFSSLTSGPKSSMKPEHDIEPTIELDSGVPARVMHRMTSDMSSRSVRFEDEVASDLSRDLNDDFDKVVEKQES